MSLAFGEPNTFSYPRLVIRFEGLPFQQRLEQLHGPDVFEYVLPLLEYIFDEAPLQKTLVHPFNHAKNPPPINCIQSSPKTWMAWREIAIALHDWLRDNKDERDSDEWLWTVNIFWIAYSACNPSFPLGKWDPVIAWDPKIVPITCEHVTQRAQGLNLRSSCKNQSWVVWNDWIALRKVWCQSGVLASDFEV
ncbi:hypothetical protein Clacol_007934 [Clathrus columnatus]|uniref:Uncharacterized protein n=1 Tax=Clathrus columnatus TaxID=1419009 RepID=A0AAV5ALW2_9AGAM|nr:hypothetical protein Clacol_007934 [Clathrus columnatus]